MQYATDERTHGGPDEQGRSKDAADGAGPDGCRGCDNLRSQDREQQEAHQLPAENRSDDAVAIAPDLGAEDRDEADDQTAQTELPVGLQPEPHETRFCVVQQGQKRRRQVPQQDTQDDEEGQLPVRPEAHVRDVKDRPVPQKRMDRRAGSDGGHHEGTEALHCRGPEDDLGDEQRAGYGSVVSGGDARGTPASHHQPQARNWSARQNAQP